MIKKSPFHSLVLVFTSLFGLTACGSSGGGAGDGSAGTAGTGGAGTGGAGTGGGGNGPTDITNATFSNRDPSCGAYAGTYTASVRDIGAGNAFTATVTITAEGSGCRITSNSIPNHDFNDGGNFANTTAEVTETFDIPAPAQGASATPLSLEFDNAIFLNGAKLDQLAAACYGVGNEPLGREMIGCFESDTPWRYDPMHPGNDFGTDSHNAHTQPDGAYHYHGDPVAMYATDGQTASGVIGFAADGFPIYGPFIDDGGTVRRVRSGYALEAGARVSQPGEGQFPGGDHDGTFRDDYEWSAANGGDLDECNGMTRDGSYGYYITDSYPWVMGCFRGTPDPSFRKMP